MDIAPALVMIASILSLYLSGLAYRFLFPYEETKRALELATEYRSLSEFIRSKRGLRKLRSIGPEYKKARSFLLRGLLAKFIMITIAYVGVALLSTLAFPVAKVPFYIPFIVVEYEGSFYMPMLYINFFSFIYAMLLFRELIL
ncbi:MAG: hypothetical protein NZ902_04155 [Acidilobaceae archaeon]|nr:hypothetical protein [Acidilobaceae archaeon]MCX8165077.1 hypothetical protein [Acidilobaceae archaeon]MDW7974406.1 hypothetical protein [Sulfolobales archaeon]